LCKEANDAFGIVNSKIGIGKALITLGDINEAIGYLKEAEQEALSMGSLETRIEAHHLLSECYEKSGDYSRALQEYKIFAQLTDTLLNKEKIKNINELQVRYETENKESQIKILTQQGEIDRLEISRQNQQISQQRNIIITAVLFIFLVGIILYLIFNRFRLKQIAAKEKAERKALEMESSLLRAQMNPHFLFNSLNSIQSYISDADTFMAETYLSKFAQLVRNILEHSRKELVTVSDDISSLRIYLEMEQLRFKKEFDFDIIIDEQIDADDNYIPPMLIQPFAENAIIHGLRHKKEKGFLQIRLSRAEDLMLCEIEDNGVGRKRSVEINQNRPKHTSLGMKVTHERIEILKQQVNKNAEVVILDLEDEMGVPVGTKVKLIIPLIQDI
jgi:LytS/YehU family sensor histidine kinase